MPSRCSLHVLAFGMSLLVTPAAALRIPNGPMRARAADGALSRGVNAMAFTPANGTPARPEENDGSKCVMLDETQMQHVNEAMDLSGNLNPGWFACETPSEDPTMTCFMPPDWVDADEPWVCSNSVALSEPCVGDGADSAFEDSW